jgi:hypothetical protein
MNQPVGLPLESKAIRFAPSRNQEPSASFWKIWAEGSEVYASSRSPGGLIKISVHASGQIHQRLEGKLKQDLAPLMRLGTGPWFHAFELRFLLSDGALSPIGQRESLKKSKKAHLIRAPEGSVLHANLIIGSAGTPLDCPLPVEFTGGQTVWARSCGTVGQRFSWHGYWNWTIRTANTSNTCGRNLGRPPRSPPCQVPSTSKFITCTGPQRVATSF